MIKRGDLAHGDVVWVDFDPSIGHEYQNIRPAIVIQSNEQLRRSNLVTIIALSSRLENMHGDDILIEASKENNLARDSVAKMHYIATFDYRRFSKKIGRADGVTMGKIKSYLAKHFDL
ncbi:MAG: type II toxin-antitoxin system PemK/MazF family toxin [Candidatus Pacebacteria bacterium]|jgi:mRNA interferase MazF|nr:type II toxin-antitoxin system PemK/MazF family toxin [Candidatus Paceibacterota bacterium]